MPARSSAMRGLQLVVRREQPLRAVEDANALVLERAADLEAGLAGIEGRDDVEAHERDVAAVEAAPAPRPG